MDRQTKTKAENLRKFRRDNPDRVLLYRLRQAARLLRRNGINDAAAYLDNVEGKQ